jgi:hypothetical protein
MWIQKLIWFLGRMIFWMLLLPLAGGIIYTLANDLHAAALILLVLFVLVVYFGLIRVRVPEHSVAVRDGKVAYFFPERTVRDRFDFVSRGQKIVQLPFFGLLDHSYKIELFCPDGNEGVRSCRLSLTLGYIPELPALQRAYDSYLLFQEFWPVEVDKLLYRSASQMEWPPFPVPEDQAADTFLSLIVARLDLSLAELGLKIEEPTCKFAAGPTLLRLVASKQETVENVAD